MNIAQSARRLVFCCTLRAGDLEVDVADGKLCIVREGTHAKFVKSVRQVCFHGPSAFARGQQVMFVTERAVFVLAAQGLALTELAPGIDLQRQVLDQMEFAPALIASASSTGRCPDAVGERAAVPCTGLARCLDPAPECRDTDASVRTRRALG